MKLKCLIKGHKYRFSKVLRDLKQPCGTNVTAFNCRIEQSVCVRCGKEKYSRKYLKKWFNHQ